MASRPASQLLQGPCPLLLRQCHRPHQTKRLRFHQAGRCHAPLQARRDRRGDQATKTPGAIAKFPFVPEAEDELKLAKGDEIFDISKVEDDWYKGTLKDGRTGIFPTNYVNIL